MRATDLPSPLDEGLRVIQWRAGPRHGSKDVSQRSIDMAPLPLTLLALLLIVIGDSYAIPTIGQSGLRASEAALCTMTFCNDWGFPCDSDHGRVRLLTAEETKSRKALTLGGT
jgi:hypothetical protein